jgi:hypothetical protein
MSEKEKIIDRVKKLRDHAVSAEKIGSEHEAQAFATMMQKLMSEYKITQSEIEHAKLDETDPVVSINTDGMTWRKGKQVRSNQRISWMELLARTVARAHYCKSAIRLGSAIQVFIGRRTDAEAAKMAFDYLATAARHLAGAAYVEAYDSAKKAGLPWLPGFNESWLVGFCQRLGERYDEEMEAIKAKWASSGTALVRLKDALTVVNQYLEKAPLRRAASLQSLDVSNLDGYQKGRRAAESIALKESSKKVGAANGS